MTLHLSLFQPFIDFVLLVGPPFVLGLLCVFVNDRLGLR